jgi:6-phosphofructokinase 1
MAVRLAEEGKFDHMVALSGDSMTSVPLAEAIKKRKKVPANGNRVKTAREIGICMGEAGELEATEKMVTGCAC